MLGTSSYKIEQLLYTQSFKCTLQIRKIQDNDNFKSQVYSDS